jgi:hypothetical protein
MRFLAAILGQAEHPSEANAAPAFPGILARKLMIDHDLKPTTLVAHPIFTQPITRVRTLPESAAAAENVGST